MQSSGCCVAVNGGWSAWQNWQDCNASCGDGWMVRKRYCNNPPPAYNGEDCGKDNSEYGTCTVVCSGTVFLLRQQLMFQIIMNVLLQW